MEGTGGPSDGSSDEVVDLQQFALLVGDMHEELTLRISPLATASPDERNRLATAGLAELRNNGFLADSEAQQLRNIVEALAGSGVSPGALAELADQTLREFQTADSASPAALAIASVAVRGTRAAATSFVERQGTSEDRQGTSEEVAADIGDVSTAGGAAMAGGIVGATAGIPFGPGGVAYGAAAGALGGLIGFAIAQELLLES